MQLFRAVFLMSHIVAGQQNHPHYPSESSRGHQAADGVQRVLQVIDTVDELPVAATTGRAPVFPPHPSDRPTGFVAFGDSYSAGIGTGFEGKEDDCRLGLHAWPALVHEDLAQGYPTYNTSFQFLSCTGATLGDVLSGGASSQIDAFNTSLTADFAVLSIGGNDLGFFDVINACVFRFYSFYSGTCEAALAFADQQIASSEFEQRLLIAIMEILDRVEWEKRPWFMITLIGYVRFFNAETEECDKCSFGIWWRGPKLKREVRRRMNELVMAVNGKLKHSVEVINAKFSRPKVLFVDYDDKFDGHRFCEPNVTEPDYNRTDTWFFLVGGKDNLGNVTDPTPSPNATSLDREPAEMLSPLSPVVDAATCLPAAESSGDWGMLALCQMARVKALHPDAQFAHEDLIIQNSMWYVPTYYGKTFHPRSLGHEVIRDEVYKAWASLE